MRLKILGGILVAVVALALSACAGSDEVETIKYVPIGNKRVKIPVDTPKETFAVTDATLKALGYKPWWRNCIIGQAEKLLTPAEAKALTELPPSKQGESGLRVALKATPHCEEPGRNVIDPDTGPRQLALLREQLAVGLKYLVIRDGATVTEQECVMDQARQMSGAQTVQLTNGQRGLQERLLVKLFERCA
jgi:hypothetical protein